MSLILVPVEPMRLRISD